MKRLVLAFGIACFPLVAHADVTADACVRIAETVAQEKTAHFSTSELEALKYNAQCTTSDSSSDASLNIIYSAFSLGGKYSETQKKEYCSKEFSSLGFKQNDYLNTKTVFKDGLEVVSQCLKLAADGWDIKYKQYDNAVSLNVAYRGAGGGEFKGLDIIPFDSSSCRDVPTLPARVLSNGVSFICERKPQTTSIDGVATTTADDSIINVRLGDGVFSVEMPGYSTSIVKTKDSEIDELRIELDQLRQQNSTLNVQNSLMKKTISDGAGLLDAVHSGIDQGKQLALDAQSNYSDSHTCSLRGSQSANFLSDAQQKFAILDQILRSGLSLAP